MTEDRINMYYPVYSLTGNFWIVLSDGAKNIIVKPEDVVLINSEKGMYSIILPKHTEGRNKKVHSIIIDHKEVKVIYERCD